MDYKQNGAKNWSLRQTMFRIALQVAHSAECDFLSNFVINVGLFKK